MITLTELKAIKGITSTTHDAEYTALIPVVDQLVERYLDRYLLQLTNSEWISTCSNGMLLASNYPINRIIWVGHPYVAATLSMPTLPWSSVSCDSTGVNIYVDPSAAVQTFSYAASTSLSALKAAIEAAIPAITMTIADGYTTFPSSLIRPTNGMEIVVADRVNDFSSTVMDNRTIQISPLDFCEYYIKWTSGYASADIPQDIKYAMANIICDIGEMNVAGANAAGIFKSETLGNYSYTLNDGIGAMSAGNIFGKYLTTLDHHRKLGV